MELRREELSPRAKPSDLGGAAYLGGDCFDPVSLRPQIGCVHRRRYIELGCKVSDMSGMDRDTVIERLRAYEAELRAEGVSHVFLFGSVARGEADEKSDVDLFYDYDSDRFGFLQFMRIRDLAPEILGRSVDIMPRDGLHPLIRPKVERAAIPVF